MDQGRIAPSLSDRRGSGTISSGSISICEPSPVQRWQAPWGELNENIRGSSSGIEVPQWRHTKRSEKVCTSPVSTSSMSTIPSARGHGRLDRVGEPLAQVRPHHQPVDHHRDVVLELLVERDLLLEPPQLAVDLHAREALGAQLLEELPVLALAAADDRREHHELRALLERHHLVDDLLGRLGRDRPAAVVAVRMADPRPQQAQVVVDLGDRADGRARVPRGGLLVDRDRRRQALDRVHVGLVHLAQELARVGGQRLHVAPLALRVDRVEGKARLAGAREPGDHDQRVARQPEVEVLEVVLARARDDELRRPASHNRVYGRPRIEHLFGLAARRARRCYNPRRGGRATILRADSDRARRPRSSAGARARSADHRRSSTRAHELARDRACNQTALSPAAATASRRPAARADPGRRRGRAAATRRALAPRAHDGGSGGSGERAGLRARRLGRRARP